MTRTLFAAAALLALSTSAFAATDVPVGHFNGVSLRGGGHVALKHGDTQRVTILKGSTQFTDITVKHGEGLEIIACNAQCPNHYDLEIEIVTPDISAIAVRGGGEIESAGGFPRQDELAAAISGGGSIDLRNVNADQVSAAVNGGGDIAVHAERSLSAAVNGGGDITYWGTPQVSSATHGGGSISRGS